MRPSRVAVPQPADGLRLEDGGRVAVIGSGPAGSLFAWFLLRMAARTGLDLHVDLFESRHFDRQAPHGCNMCGGIISESLVQNLAAEGIPLPGDVVQRGIDSYVLHMDVGSVRIATPLHEMRIGAVHRGAGPRDAAGARWASFDRHLQARAQAAGARLVDQRVDGITRLPDGRLQIRSRDGVTTTCDLVVVAAGVNTGILKAFEALGTGYRRPATTKTLIREYYLGEEAITRTLGSSMHVFLLNIPRLEFAAIIPKGDYVTMCLLGQDIDTALVEAFAASPEVRACMPPDWRPDGRSCQCLPFINVRGAAQPYADRLLFIGDSGVTRLYKDGIGAAYRTAKAAARTAVFEGVSAEAFRRHYFPVCRRIAADNAVGRVAFALTGIVQHARLFRRALLRQVMAEQQRPGRSRWMSGVLWDMFSGSAPYADIFRRMVHPALLVGLALSLAGALRPGKPLPASEVMQP